MCNPARNLLNVSACPCAAVFFLALSWCTGAPAAAETRPATRPTTASTTTATTPSTHPSTVPVFTLATPRDSLKFFAAALRDGDVGRLRQAVIAENDAQERMVTAIADMSRALSSLHAAAKQVYGVEAAARFTDDTAAGFEQTLTRIDAADVTIDQDKATVRYPDDKENPYELRKVGEEWKVPATQFTQGAEPPALERRIGELSAQTRIVLDIAKEITASKHKSAEAAGLAWRSKMMAALTGENPGSKPATKPGGK